jgi:hypothetical protein
MGTCACVHSCLHAGRAMLRVARPVVSVAAGQYSTAWKHLAPSGCQTGGCCRVHTSAPRHSSWGCERASRAGALLQLLPQLPFRTMWSGCTRARGVGAAGARWRVRRAAAARGLQSACGSRPARTVLNLLQSNPAWPCRTAYDHHPRRVVPKGRGNAPRHQ